MLKVWGRISSINVRKVVLCAQMLDIPFQRIDAGLSFGVVDTPDYLKLNPNAMVPTIQDGACTLWESNVIVRYLCAKENRLYPSDLHARFIAEQWMDWQQTSLNRASGVAFVQWIRTSETERNLALIDHSVSATEPLMDLLNQLLENRLFIAGEQMSMADIPIACEVHRWWGLPQSRPSWPHLERWYAQMRQHPGSVGVLDLPLT